MIDKPPFFLVSVGMFVGALILSMSSEACAATITFDLTSGGNAGPNLDDSGTGSYTEGGVTIAAVATGGVVNSEPVRMGVGAASGTDNLEEIEPPEDLTFTITFGALNVTLTEFDFSGAGSTGGGDAVLLSINGGSNIVLETGAANFNGSTDKWTSPSLVLSSGDTFKVAAQESVGVQNIILEVIAIPEPATAILMALAVFGFATGRRVS